MGRAVTAAGSSSLTEDNSQAELLAHELCELNRQRQAVELEIFNQCLALLAGRKQYDCLVLADKAWHQGWWASWPPAWPSSTPARCL